MAFRLRPILSVYMLITAAALSAQQEIPELTSKDSIPTSYWLAGLGINIVDDSWRAREVFPIEDRWNIVPFPSRLSFGRYFRSGLGVELIGTYNQYKVGKIIDGRENTQQTDYWAADARLSYDLNRLVGETGPLDPYVGAGLGITDAHNDSRTTYNAIVGFRLWFADRWGADLNASGKWAVESESTNHLQYAAGVVYRFGMEKELSRRGLEKKALIEQLLAEEQRVADSLQAAREAEERARQLALEQERLRQEAQAAEEAARRKEEEARRQGLSRALDSIGKVTFAFDSYQLNPESRKVLSEMAEFMAAHNGLEFSISGHTDSRGPAPYNQWLSEKRAESVFEYLRGQGVVPGRLEVSGYGESQLLNHCADGIRCSAREHAANRRTEIRITGY